MNKKGGGNILAGKTGYYIIYIFIFAISIAIAAAFINDKVITEVDFSQLEIDVVSSIIFDCFKGSEFGIIDYNKFDENNLNKCFDVEVYHIKLELKLIDSHLSDRPIKNFNFNSENKAEFYVLVEEEDEGKIERGILYLEFENVT